ncbi:MAG: hypothetical protein WBV98_25220 [Candidatus Sulfotelmatobacter sp.]
MKETAFEFFPPHEVVDIAPIAPETEVMPPSGGLNTKTNTVPDCAMSVVVMAATNSWLLMNFVTRKEPFQLTTESLRKSLPLTVNKNWLPPAVALLGEIEVMDGTGGQFPQDRTVTSMIASTGMRAHLGTLAIGLHLRQLADGIERCSGKSGWSVDRWDCGTSQLVRQIPRLYAVWFVLRLVQNLYPRGHPRTPNPSFVAQQLPTIAEETPSGHWGQHDSGSNLRLGRRLQLEMTVG